MSTIWKPQSLPRWTARPGALLQVPCPDFPERHQTALRFVPQHERYAPEALKQRNASDVTQFRVITQHARQPVIGNTAGEMVYVVNADVGREPAQQCRQFVM